MSTMILRPDRVWRLVMTGLCLALSSLDGLLLSTIWFNVPLIAVWDKARRRHIARCSIAASFRLFLTAAKRPGALDYQTKGRDVLHDEQGCLVIANHPALINYVLLVLVMLETDCLMRSVLLKNPFFGDVVRAVDYLANSRVDVLLSACQQRLEWGDITLAFPKGTRTRPGEAMMLQRSAADIAVRCSSDLRIVTINYSK